MIKDQPITDLNIHSLGDSAASIDFGNRIDEATNLQVIAMQQCIADHPMEGVKEVIVAYSSLTIYYDPVCIRKHHPEHATAFAFIQALLQAAYTAASPTQFPSREPIYLPVCYEPGYGADLDRLAETTGLSPSDIVALHTARVYRVYMIGFLPGFSYLGTVDPRLVVPRKPRPVPVAAGSVGIAGAQTGIYPCNSPGGWQIIGTTPVKQFDAQAPLPVTLQIGDRVQFYAISTADFEKAMT